MANGLSLRPVYEYVDPLDSAVITKEQLFIGAFPVIANGYVREISERQGSYNYPNPFHNKTEITLPRTFESLGVALDIYDTRGILISSTLCIVLDSQIEWERGNVPSGIYYYCVHSQDDKEISNGRIVINP
jgi:hypothetical protein